MQAIGAFLDTQPFIALFVVIGLGYALGRVRIGGFSLGIGAVLFVGLAVGAIAPKATPPGLLGSIGLILFLYCTGIQYGRTFFKGLVSRFGLRANLLAAVAVVAGSGAALLCARWFGFSVESATGMFAGSLTSTASLQTAISVSGSDMPAVAYAIAYPFGVVRSDPAVLPHPQAAAPEGGGGGQPAPDCRRDRRRPGRPGRPHDRPGAATTADGDRSGNAAP